MTTQSAKQNYEGVWGNRIGLGDRPALLVIDFMDGYIVEGSPLFAPGVVSAVEECVGLLAAARRASLPIIHTNIRYFEPDSADGGMWVRKSPVMKAMQDGNPLAEFCAAVAPRASERVVTKQYASAFFGTDLARMLRADGIDTIFLTGCSTSGCIRATAVDGVQYGFRVSVIRECVGDRHPDPHEANLFDIDAKYGDVLSKQEAIEAFDRYAIATRAKETS